jgi:hypothetical protein
MWRSGVFRHVRMVAMLLAGAAATALLASCAVPGPPPVAMGSAAQSAADPAGRVSDGESRASEILGTALQYAWLNPPVFSAEPTGDLNSDQLSRVYAHIEAVCADPPRITFDVVQYYPSGDQAARAALQDKRPVPEEGGYERNRFRHPQMLRVAKAAGVIGEFGDEHDVSYGVGDAAQPSAIPFAEFAKRYADPQRGGLRSAGYWVEFDSVGVQNIVMQYEP